MYRFLNFLITRTHYTLVDYINFICDVEFERFHGFVIYNHSAIIN